MTSIKVIFSDVGGVLATNGWDHISRKKAAQQFDLNWSEFEGKHDEVAGALDMGQITLLQYLDATIFYTARTFSIESYIAFMKNESVPFLPSLALMKDLAAQGKYRMATLNNESIELNKYRIEKFALKQYFSFFFSSCYMGLRKPDAEIYQRALLISQCEPSEVVFIDDREGNLEAPKALGMQTILFTDAEELQASLHRLDVQC